MRLSASPPAPAGTTRRPRPAISPTPRRSSVPSVLARAVAVYLQTRPSSDSILVGRSTKRWRYLWATKRQITVCYLLLIDQCLDINLRPSVKAPSLAPSPKPTAISTTGELVMFTLQPSVNNLFLSLSCSAYGHQ